MFFQFTISPQVIGASAIIYILAGILTCFAGARIFKLILGIWGFLLGFGLVTYFFNLYLTPTNQLVLLIAGIAGGVIGVFLFTSLFKVGLFAIGAFFGYSLGLMFMAASGTPSNPVILVLAAIIGGAIALFVKRPMIILSTAFGGAYLILLGIVSLRGGLFDILSVIQQPEQFKNQDLQFYIYFGGWLLAALAGTLFQFRTSGRE